MLDPHVFNRINCMNDLLRGILTMRTNPILRFVFIVALALLAALAATASAKKEKVGVLKDGFYRDNTFGFSCSLPKDWKAAGLKDEPAPDRLIMLQKNPRIPLKLQGAPEEALQPIIMVFADSANDAPEVFLDSLKSGRVKNQFRERILSKSIFFQRGSPHPAEMTNPISTMFGGLAAVRYDIRREYSVRLEGTDIEPPKQVRDYRVGSIYLVPQNGAMIYIEMACESQFRDELRDDFDAFMNSFSFAPPVDSAGSVEP